MSKALARSRNIISLFNLLSNRSVIRLYVVHKFDKVDFFCGNPCCLFDKIFLLITWDNTDLVWK